jgi:GT2 family glycosyltransferase
MAADSPLVSFVIPVRNDAARLERCLSSIRACAYPADRVEIVVVDNGSSDGSQGVALAAGARLVERPGLSVAALRNTGAEIGSGGILAFVDADHAIGPDWILAAVETLSASDAGISGTLCQAPPDGTWVQHLYDAFRPHAPHARDVEWLGSGNMAVRRDVFTHACGFDVSLDTCEDVDLCHRTRQLGWRVVDEPRMRSIHYGDPATLRALLVGELWRGRDNLRASLRSITWRGLPSLVIPVAQLALCAAALAGVAASAVGGVWLSLWAVVGVALLSLPRVAMMLTRMRRRDPVHIARAWAVATVYDLARAFAPVTRMSHARRARTGKP